MIKRIIPHALIALMILAPNFTLTPPAFAAENDLVWKANFGGNENDFFVSVAAVSDGIVAVGRTKQKDRWEGNVVYATLDGDAIIVNFDNNGNVIWEKTFGGKQSSEFSAVTVVSDGIVAVGSSSRDTFGNGDLEGLVGNGWHDAIIVKYDFNGKIVWKKNFGSNSGDFFHAVTTVPGGVVAVGRSQGGFGYSDLEGINGNGSDDAIIVKFDNNGNVVWKKGFGGSDYDFYNSVTAVSDGIIAVGYSEVGSFGNGNWTGVSTEGIGFGNGDAIIIKYDFNGNIVWQKSLTGKAEIGYTSVTTVSDGFIAVGSTIYGTFGNGDWANFVAKGEIDAIIVKYNNDGNIVWKNNFGGGNRFFGSWSQFGSVTAVSDGIIAVGYSRKDSFGSGDWDGVKGNGSDDAIIVKYDNNGKVVWKKNLGGSSLDFFQSVTAVSDGIVVVGNSYEDSFGSGDWVGVMANGNGDAYDATIVKYEGSGAPPPIIFDPVPTPTNLDTASVWAQEGIQSAFVKGFIPTDLLDKYQSVITRAEFCRMAVKWVEYKTGKDIDTVLAENGLFRDTNTFSDTNDPDILAAYTLGITNGTKAPTTTSPGTFDPDGEFNREQAATMVRNTCKAIGMDVSNTSDQGFADIGSASDWARNGINFCRANGIMNGTSATPLLFTPKGTYTRQESIVTFNNIK